MKWNEKAHPRKPDGEFRESGAGWAARAAERMMSPSAPRPPHAAVLGYRRVGDHPTGAGRLHDSGGTMPMSSHPDAGGLWIDPNRPGTVHAPAYRNDMGWLVSGLQPKVHRTTERKQALQIQRREGMYGSPEGLDRRELQRGGEVIGERLGYEGSPEFRTFVKRAKARTLQETQRQPKRRTPRGTAVENWMNP